jgi:FSR family fosmidomycin resistance protein-like MFS transporter
VYVKETERAAPGLRVNPKLIGVLALGHLTVDLAQGSFPAILPLLKSAHSLSYSAAGTLVLVASLTSSLVQPLFGYFADCRSRHWMLPSAVLCAGLGLGLIGFPRNYWGVLGFLVLMSLGVAAYHPEGFRTVTSVAGERRATALSWFSLGGNLGVALGPPFVTALVTDLGLYGTLGIMGPVSVMATVLLAVQRRLSSLHGIAGGANPPAVGRNMPYAVALLMGVVMIRSWTQLGFVTFLPFYYVDYLKAPPRLVGPLLFVFLGAGALGTVLAGPLADRWGARKFTVLGMLCSVPLGVIFLVLGGTASWIMLAVFGAVLVSTFSVTVVLGQLYLPRSPGLASGLIVGFAVGTGGVGVALLGWVADHFGLPVVLWISALLPIIGFVTALFLPSPDREVAHKWSSPRGIPTR